MSEPTLWNKFTAFMGGTVVTTINEIRMLMPDSILFGSLLLYFLTQNLSFGIFAVFIFETSLSHKLISWVSSQAVGPSRPVDIQCRPGYKTPQTGPQRMFMHDTYPSYGVYSITAIATYLALATKEFSATLDAMGPEWSSRGAMAYAFIGLVLAAFIGTQIYRCNDSMSEILMAAVFAVVAGFIFFYVNKSLFGEEAMNFLGLPYLVSKESQGSPIYVCAAEKQDPTSA
jgi:hypothetical protein